MPIEGVNSAMTTLQFAQVRSATRSVETTGPTTSHAAGRGHAGFPAANPAPAARPIAVDRLVVPRSFHWSYRPTVVNGKRAAKRTPQLADTDYWSFSLNRLG